jgi:hypothetical protein
MTLFPVLVEVMVELADGTRQLCSTQPVFARAAHAEHDPVLWRFGARRTGEGFHADEVAVGAVGTASC